jgi:hypothetical protein
MAQEFETLRQAQGRLWGALLLWRVRKNNSQNNRGFLRPLRMLRNDTSAEELGAFDTQVHLGGAGLLGWQGQLSRAAASSACRSILIIPIMACIALG